jgi:long-chain acyl-CoA synthetase
VWPSWKTKNSACRFLCALNTRIADRLVFTKWREGIGGRLRYFVSGGAPLSPRLSYSFLGAGIKILQGYGMTETCIVCANRPEDNCVGSIGKPFKGIEVKTAPDGELLMSRRECDARLLRPSRSDAGGNARRMVRDRRRWPYRQRRSYLHHRSQKDLFKLSNGKYIAPQQIESLLKQSEFVNQAVVIGSSRKYPAALIVPDWEAVKSALRAAGESVAERTKRSRCNRLPQDSAARRHENHGAPGGLRTVRRVALLPHEFSIDAGEMTPTLKVKRNVIDERYAELIDDLYRGA